MNLPRFVQIEPVGQCNLACKMCPVMFREEKPPAFMSYDTFCRLIDQFPGVTELHLQGAVLDDGATGGAAFSNSLDFRLIGSRLYARSDWEEAIRLAADGAVSLAPLVSRRIPLESLQEGMEQALDGGPVMKVLVDLTV